MSFFRISLLTAAVFATIAQAGAVDLNAAIPVGPQVKLGKLPNGLTYYVQRNGKPEHKVELRLVVKAGSVLEDEDQQGLAHMVEHLAFNGSTHFKQQELVSYLQSIGLKIGADLNASTGVDETVYMLPVPTDRKENVDVAFTVLEDWAHGVSMTPESIDKERTIVLEEARARKGVQQRVQLAMLPKLFTGSKYASRVPIGKEEVIRNATLDTVQRFYHDWYRPDLMAVIVVGDIDPAEAERQIKSHFAGLSNPVNDRPRNYPDIAPRKLTEAFVLTDAEIPVNSIALHYSPRFEPDLGTYGSYRDKLVANLYTIMLNQRFAELAQQPNPPFMGAGGGNSPMTARYKEFVLGAALGAGGAAPAFAALEQEQQRVRQYGFAAPELERARKAMLTSLEHAYNERTTTDSSAFAGEYQRNFLANEDIPGIATEYRLAQELLPAISEDDVNAAARKVFAPSTGKLVVYVGGTKSGPTPSEQQLLADVAADEHLQVQKRDEKALATRLMERPSKPGAIVAESHDQKLGLTRLTLSNGVKVILKPSDFRKDQVLLGAKRYGGQTEFDATDVPNARIAAPLAMAMGVRDYNQLDLQKVLAGRNAAANAVLGMYTDEISGSSGSSPEDLEAMLQMLWLRFDGVRRDENVYNAVKSSVTETVRNRTASPEARFGDAIVEAVYGGNAYEPRAFVAADVQKLDLDRSIALYRKRFSSAKGMTFVLVGDFDVTTIKPLVASYLGTLPTPDLPLNYRDVGLRMAKGVVKKEVVAGTEPKSILSLTFSGPAEWSQAATLRMGALTEVMNQRLFSILREKEGLIYSGQVTGSVQRIPYQHYELSAQMPTGPDKVKRLEVAIFAEIDSLKAKGPTKEELDKVKANWRQNYPQWQRENGYWLGNLEESLLDGTDPTRLLTINREIEALTATDVQQAAQHYLDTKNYAEVVLNPEALVKTASTQAHQ
jgi:zinc protease